MSSTQLSLFLRVVCCLKIHSMRDSISLYYIPSLSVYLYIYLSLSITCGVDNGEKEEHS
jgi:hypothetical protein